VTAPNFRDNLTVPAWLRAGLGRKILYAIAVHADLLADAVAQAVKHRFPGHTYYSDANDLSGRDRKIRRGIGEPEDVYSARLAAWQQTHATRGGPYAMLREIFNRYRYSQSGPFHVELWSQNGQRYVMNTDGEITNDQTRTGYGSSHGRWQFDADLFKWARWWLWFDWPVAATNDGIWSSPGTWGDPGVWDCSLSSTELTSLREIPSEWNAAHCQGAIILAGSSGPLAWDFPSGIWGDETGTWGGSSGYKPAVIGVDLESA
jgi:hypothetical protein